MSIHVLVSLALVNGCDLFGSLFVVVIKSHPWRLFCSETCHPIFFIVVKTDWMQKPAVFFFHLQKSLWAPFLHKSCESQAFLQLSDVLSEHQSLISQQCQVRTVIIIHYCSYRFARSPLLMAFFFFSYQKY